jgi:hypothetical protein
VPAKYTIDQDERLVTSVLWGPVSEDEVHDHNRRLRSDPLFDPSYRQLADMSGITEVLVSTGMIRETSQDPFFKPGAPRAFVAASDGVFGMARMFASHAEGLGQTIEVFRDRPSAEAWLTAKRGAVKDRS